MEEKKTILLECQGLVEAIRQLDDESESEARRLDNESKCALEEERKLFKAGMYVFVFTHIVSLAHITFYHC